MNRSPRSTIAFLSLLALMFLGVSLALAQDDPAPESDTKSAPAEAGREVSEKALARPAQKRLASEGLASLPSASEATRTPCSSALVRRMAMRVSSSGGWMSAMRP